MAAAPRTLRALVVEDVETDAELLVRELWRGGFTVEHQRVETAAAMAAALAERTWDLVVSDYSMPTFGALDALAVLKQSGLDLPFIIVSGTIGEEVAVAALQAGAHDFVSKGKLARLLPAIERELREVAARREHRRVQEHLLISDRMASVGLLAAGVGHEINNPLAILMANLEFALQDLRIVDDNLRGEVDAPPVVDAALLHLDRIHESLRDAREASERVRHIVRDLKLFSHPDGHHSGAVDLRRVIDTSVRMAWNEIRHRSRLVKQYGDVPMVEGNEGRLSQVILNLVINAAQSMVEGRADENEIRISTRLEGADHVVIDVRDSGGGIAPAQLARIFDPFFTTKPTDVGTGLGLTICQRIVTSMGGTITVDSELGTGTCFHVTLPVSSRRAPSAEVERVVVPAVRRGRILVIDDDPLIGSALRRMLAGDHEVTTRTSARDALGYLRSGAACDMIICDLMMPEMTGVDLHAELARAEVELADKMVFMTGGAFTPATRAFLDAVRNPRVDKPIDWPALKALVHHLIR